MAASTDTAPTVAHAGAGTALGLVLPVLHDPDASRGPDRISSHHDYVTVVGHLWHDDTWGDPVMPFPASLDLDAQPTAAAPPAAVRAHREGRGVQHHLVPVVWSADLEQWVCPHATFTDGGNHAAAADGRLREWLTDVARSPLHDSLPIHDLRQR